VPRRRHEPRVVMGRQVDETAGGQRLALDLDRPVEHVQKPLCGRWSDFAFGPNSTVYCVNSAPPAGAMCTIAVAFRIPGNAARMNVSGVCRR
jgi:hypothetical protein